ncbi:MAG TPA: methylene-tetrahydromethanopterin dehydrogenase N-terminal domain-containing protein [Candidatus Polarisedimenticolia bacterium]|nr:methylene-tetrahydromethanopterin dehydrogenase N-terminal domain-containing protein [Candidatus Polarisedimenticolia bacterium]
MERKRLLYLISADARVSPFDINMAYDAGFDAVIPYARVDAADVPGLVQDIMFSRGAKGARFSSLFFSSAGVASAEGMLKAARRTLFPPFQVGLMIDPKGGYTTAAALLARAAALCRDRGMGEIGRLRVLVAAGTGGVGRAAAAMAAQDGARVVLTSRSAAAAAAAGKELETLFGARVEACAAPGEGELAALAARSDVIFATGAAGVSLLTTRSIESLKGPKVLADVNAVPPHGLEGVKPQDNGTEIAPGLYALGAMAVGDLKFKVESSLLKDLLQAEAPPVIDSQAARRRASEILETK